MTIAGPAVRVTRLYRAGPNRGIKVQIRLWHFVPKCFGAKCDFFLCQLQEIRVFKANGLIQAILNQAVGLQTEFCNWLLV